jgi:hypothetical protein
MSQKFSMDDYVDVAERIQDFKKQYPEGTLRQVHLEFINIGGKDFVVYTAAAYRTPDDQAPGIGTAWEPIPGKTPYTKDSEVMVCETSAWGRAIVAVTGAGTKRIASKQEVQNRQAPKRDFYSEATKVKSIDKLRELWAEARAAGADDKTLERIIGLSNGLQD